MGLFEDININLTQTLKSEENRKQKAILNIFQTFDNFAELD